MKNNAKKLTVFAVAAVSLIAFSALVIHNYKTKTSFKYDSKAAEELKPDQNPQDTVSAAVNAEAASDKIRQNSNLLKILPDDAVVGSESAPVLFIEYASLSCPHCASFVRESFDKLKTEYIDAGKIKFVYRDFPLNQQALIASMFATCQASTDGKVVGEKYYFLLKALFKTQESWAFDEKYKEKLESIAKLDGMSSEAFNKCINDSALQEKILSKRMDASKSLALKSTPSFFVNGEIIEGYVDYQTIKKLIEKKLSEVKK